MGHPVIKADGHGNKFHAIVTINKICCNRMKMFSCVPMVISMRLQYFWPKILFPKQNFHAAKETCGKNLTCLHFETIFCNVYYLTNQISVYTNSKKSKQISHHVYSKSIVFICLNVHVVFFIRISHIRTSRLRFDRNLRTS